MSKIICISLAATAAILSVPSTVSAQAATGAGTSYNLFSGASNTGTFGNNGMIGDATFSNTFTFIVTRGGILASDFTNSASRNDGDTDIDFESGILTGGSLAGPVSFVRLIGEPGTLTEAWALDGPLNIAAGTYMLTIAGRSYGPSSTLAGNFNVAATVPEPAAWGLMIAGVGMVGGAMRRRKVVAEASPA